MSYESLVEAGREARHQADNVQWTEGDLALQVEHLPSAERPRDPDTGAFLEDDAKALKRYAADIGVAYSTIKTYRRVADAWPHGKRALVVGWDVHRALTAQDDRFELIHPTLSVRQAEEIVRKRNAASRGRPGWFELLGEVGDTLVKAGKQLAKAEDAIEDPSSDLAAKAEEYAAWADDLARRLRAIAA
jgi:hypothetical protein